MASEIQVGEKMLLVNKSHDKKFYFWKPKETFQIISPGFQW